MPPSLEQCLERFPEDILDKVCDDQHLNELIGKFSQFRGVSAFLGLTSVKEDDIEQKTRSPKMQRKYMLQIWKENKQEKATYRYRVNLGGVALSHNPTFMLNIECLVEQGIIMTLSRFVQLVSRN